MGSITTQIITAGFTKKPYRLCKGCNRKIDVGEKCIRYKRPHGCTYHCYECGMRYNPSAFDS